MQDMQIGYRDAVRNRRGGNVSSESLMLTKDENMINAKFITKFVFKIPNYLV
jgi:membrane protease subunit HflK